MVGGDVGHRLHTQTGQGPDVSRDACTNSAGASPAVTSSNIKQSGIFPEGTEREGGGELGGLIAGRG